MPDTDLEVSRKLPVPEKPDFWSLLAKHFPAEYDYVVSLVRAFRVKGWESIRIDSKEQEFQANAVALGMKLGLLEFEGERGSDLEQYTAYVYRMSDLGRRILLDPSSPSTYLPK